MNHQRKMVMSILGELSRKKYKLWSLLKIFISYLHDVYKKSKSVFLPYNFVFICRVAYLNIYFIKYLSTTKRDRKVKHISSLYQFTI